MNIKIGLLKLGVLLLAVLVVMPAGSWAADLGLVGAGARSLGMGRAYTAVASGADAVFSNPAGLGKAKGFKFDSMQTKLLDEFSYLMLGGSWSIDDAQSVGIGVINASTSDISLRNGSDDLLGSAAYGNAFYSLGYGIDLGQKFNRWENWYLGANLKQLQVIADGSDTAREGSGAGLSLDLGLMRDLSDWFALGLNVQNVLGSKMVYANGYSESIVSLSKVGVKLNLLGEEGLMVKNNPQNLDLAMDANLFSSLAEPATLHLGVEYTPSESLALRAGLDQDPSGGQVVTNLSAGVGICYRGYAINYAYHPYGAITSNAAHFISIAYTGTGAGQRLAVDKPSDKFITYAENIEVSGRVESAGKKALVRVAGITAAPDAKGYFRAVVPLKIGKNGIKIDLVKHDQVIETAAVRVLRLAQFSDVKAETLAKEKIEYWATIGMAEGFKDGKFKPQSALSRAELTALLVRMTNIKTADVKYAVFRDVPARHWANPYLKVAKDYYLVEGYPDRTFKPKKIINRAECASIAARFDNDITIPNIVAAAPYSDVDIEHWAAPSISIAKAKQLLAGLKGGKFEPKRALTRCEFVDILSRTSIGEKQVKDLLDFNLGYFSSETQMVYLPNKNIKKAKNPHNQKVANLK